MRHPVEENSHVSVVGVELGVAHGHINPGMTQLLLEQVQGDSSTCQMHSGSVSVVVNPVVVDARWLTGPVVFFLNRSSRNREQAVLTRQIHLGHVR